MCFSFTEKTVRPKNITCTSTRKAAQKLGHPSRKGKANQPTVTLTNYFQMKAKADRLHLLPSDEPDGRKSVNPSPGSDQTVPQNKKTATSLILFEEVNHLANPHCNTYHYLDLSLLHMFRLVWSFLYLSATAGWCHFSWWCGFLFGHQNVHDDH